LSNQKSQKHDLLLSFASAEVNTTGLQ